MDDISQTSAKKLIDENDQHSHDLFDPIKTSTTNSCPEGDQKVGIEISDGKGNENLPKKRSKCYLFLLPFVIIFEPIIKIRYYKYSNGEFVDSVFSLITMIAICFHVFPISLVIYFGITYLVTVWVEFSNFLNMSSDESLSDSIKKAIQKSGEILPRDEASIKKFVDLFGEEPPKFGNSKLFVALILSLTYIAFICYAIISAGYSDNLTWIGAFALCFTVLSKGFNLFRIYIVIFAILASSTELLRSSFGKYDKEAILQQTSRIRKSTSLVREMCKTYSLIEISDTISFFWILFIVLATSLFDIPDITSYLGSGNSQLNQALMIQNNGGYISFCQLYLAGSAMQFGFKLWAGYKRNSLHEKVESEFNEIKSQFSYISKLPESFISTTKAGDKISPHFNEIIQWEGIQVREMGEEYFEKREEEPFYLQKKYNIEYLLDRIKEEQGLSEVTYSQLLILLSKQAHKSSKRLSLVVEEFQKFYQKVEYKLFGYWSINDTLISKLAMTVGTSVVAYIFSYLAKHPDF